MLTILPLTRRRAAALLLSTLGLMGLVASCGKDYLSVTPQGQPKSEAFFTTQEQAMQSVNAAYAKLREWNLSAFNWLAVTTLTSDDADKGSVPGDAAFLDDFAYFRLTSTAGPVDGYWTGQYQGINLTNQSITRIPTIDMDAAMKSRLIGEAQFLRAYYYFNLVRAFGGVPLYTKPADTPAELNVPRAPAEDVYAQMASDLTAAAAVLPAKYPPGDVGRATKGAALALLAKVRMYQKQWPEVLSLTSQVMGLGYSLVPDFYGMFRIAGENGPESIFEVQSNTLASNCDASNDQWAEVQGARPQFGWGFFTPTAALDNAFEPGDKRKAGTILYRGTVTPAGDSITAKSASPRYNMKAYVPGSAPRVCGYGRDQNMRVLRYAEVLLMNAEAANETGQTQQALTSVNQVRARAGLAPLQGLGQEQLRQAIWQERHVELALENGDRYFDLVRQGRAAQVLASRGFQAGKNELMPIPLNQITLSGGVLTQNPGY